MTFAFLLIVWLSVSFYCSEIIDAVKSTYCPIYVDISTFAFELPLYSFRFEFCVVHISFDVEFLEVRKSGNFSSMVLL